MDRFRAGDPDAAVELFASYNAVIREVVRRRLPPRLRREFDSLDFTQDVWANFCSLPANHDFQNQESLQAFLALVATNKVIDAYRRRYSARDYGRTRDREIEPVADPSPSASQWAMADERWESIVESLPAPHLAIVERLREGFTQQEVAEMAGISVRSVLRIVDRIQRFCEETK